MRPLRWRTLLVVAVASGIVFGVASWSMLRSGATPVDVPWTTLPVAVAASAAVLVMAWPVRQYTQGKRGPVAPHRAVRAVLVAQASAYAGALLLGVYGGYMISLLPDWGHEPRRQIALAAALCALGGAFMLTAGVIGEGWCRVGSDDDDPGQGGRTAPVAH